MGVSQPVAKSVCDPPVPSLDGVVAEIEHCIIQLDHEHPVPLEIVKCGVPHSESPVLIHLRRSIFPATAAEINAVLYSTNLDISISIFSIL